MMELAKKRGFKMALRIAALAGVSAGLSGCYSDFGLGYASDGYGQYDCDPYSQFDSYYNCDYGYGFNNIGYGGGWYDNFYYPGYGIFLFDNYGRRYNMRDDHRRYWGGQRFTWQREHYRGNQHGGGQYGGGQYGGGRQGGGYYPQPQHRDHDRDGDHRGGDWRGGRDGDGGHHGRGNGSGGGEQGGNRPHSAIPPMPAQPRSEPGRGRGGEVWQGQNGGVGFSAPPVRDGEQSNGGQRDGDGRRGRGGRSADERGGQGGNFVAPVQRDFGGQDRGEVAPQREPQPRIEAPTVQQQSYEPRVERAQPAPRPQPARKERSDGGGDLSADPA